MINTLLMYICMYSFDSLSDILVIDTNCALTVKYAMNYFTK